MNCMKCGKETGDGQVFCEDCLGIMAQYPVRQGTPVHLPNYVSSAEKKAPAKKRQPTAEERLVRFQSATRWLSIALVSSLLILSITISLLVNSLNTPTTTQHDIGKNYNTVNTLGKND